MTRQTETTEPKAPTEAGGQVERVVRRIDACQDEEKKLRMLLFYAHGSAGHCLYGDDGECMCNTCGCDFANDSADTLEQKLYSYNQQLYIQQQRELTYTWIEQTKAPNGAPEE
mgnify:CR=1 FL=1